jgi:prepilin-type N-terminal cleavage/methylation domain-containing protein
MEPRAMNERTGKRGGFTLIELLVVISVIAVLLSVLLPALGGARENSRRVKCLANLRSIGTGVHMYMEAESKGILLPKVRPLNSGTNTNDPSLLEILSKYTDAAVPFEQAPDDWIVSDPWRCPSDRGSADQATGYKPLWQSNGTSYEYAAGEAIIAAELLSIRNPHFGVSKAYMEHPTKLPVVLDADNWHNPRFAKNQIYGAPAPNRDEERAQWDRNAVFYGDWHADKAPFANDEDITLLMTNVVRFGGGF